MKALQLLRGIYLYKNVKVILIGGSPMSGKTTLATKLAQRYEYNCILTDDIGEILESVVTISPMSDMDYHEYYIKRSLEDLCIDAWECHQKIWPAVKRLIKVHSEWGTPIIVEGWALYPILLQNSVVETTKRIWLISDLTVLKNRLINAKEFIAGASDEDMMVKKYLQRSIWHNERIYQQATEIGDTYIKITKELTEENLVKKAIELLR